jgi:hypothetical protein
VSTFLLGVLVGVLVGVLAGAGARLLSEAVLSALRRWAAKREQVNASIELRVSRVAADDRLKFGLLHVCDGRLQESETINEEHCFERQGVSAEAADAVTLIAETRYRRKLGLQFKCFVDHKDVRFETVSELLGREAAIGEIMPSARPERAMFLLTSYKTTNEDGLTNNFLWPA